MKPLAILGGVALFTSAARELVRRVRVRTAERHGLTPDAVLSSNTRAAVAARYEWLRLVRDSWDLSASDTARLCGVYHQTVLIAETRRPFLEAAP